MKVLLSLSLSLRLAELIINLNNGEQRLLVVASVIAVSERRPLVAGSPSEQLGDFLGGSSEGVSSAIILVLPVQSLNWTQVTFLSH